MKFDKELVKGSLVPIVLKLLSQKEMYGYEMAREVNQRTQGAIQWREGSLYPCLHRMESEALVRSVWREAPSGKKRKYYRVTRKGLAALAKRTEEWREFAYQVSCLLMGAAS